MSRTRWPLRSTGSTDEYETDDQSVGSDSSYDGGVAPARAAFGARVGVGGANNRNRGRPAAARKTRGGNGSARSGGVSGSDRNRAKAKGGGPANGGRAAGGAAAAAGRGGARRSLRRKKSLEDSDIELLSDSEEDEEDDEKYDDDDSYRGDSNVSEDDTLEAVSRKPGGRGRTNAKGRGTKTVEDSDDERDTLEVASKKSGGRGRRGRQVLKNINGARSSTGGDCSDDSDEDSGSEGDYLPSNKRRKTLFDSSSSDSDDSMDLGRNRNKALEARRRRVMSRGFSSSESESEDDSDSDRKRRAPRARAVAKEGLSEDSDSSSSVVGLKASPRKNPTRRARSPIQKKPTARATEAKKTAIEDLLSSDDESLGAASPRRSPDPTTTAPRRSPRRKSHDPAVRAKTNKAREESRRAREALRAAQDYEADEVELSPSAPSLAVAAAVSRAGRTRRGSGGRGAARAETVDADAPSAVAEKYVGPTVRLALRYRNPTSDREARSTLKIKMDQPLRHLVDEFDNGNPGLKLSAINFDGQTLDLDKAPGFYDMENEDLLDASVAIIHPRSPEGLAQAASARSRREGALFTIHVRRKGQSINGGGSHTFKINKTDPLSKLVDAYCLHYQLEAVTLEHSGQVLDPTLSPSAQDVPSVAYLDAVVIRGMEGEGTASAGGGGCVKVKFRVNGALADVETLSISLRSQFRSAMANFAQKRRVDVTKCKFVFDGEELPPTSTPQGLDLEGGEIVDVTLPAAAAPVSRGEKEGGGDANSAEAAAAARGGAGARTETSPVSNQQRHTGVNISIKTNRNVSLGTGCRIM